VNIFKNHPFLYNSQVNISKKMDIKIKKTVLSAQRAEVTEHLIYMRLSEQCKDENNADVCENRTSGKRSC